MIYIQVCFVVFLCIEH